VPEGSIPLYQEINFRFTRTGYAPHFAAHPKYRGWGVALSGGLGHFALDLNPFSPSRPA